MSVQFGRIDFDGAPVDLDYFEKVRALIRPYAPDGEGVYCQGPVHILYRSLHTTRESRRETQPHTTGSGDVIAWDGRLDNRAELIARLGGELSSSATDLAIVAEAYERWRTDCFARLVGDWAVSIWCTEDREVLLARDFVGARPLYYHVEQDEVTWSTLLDPLVLLTGKTWKLDEEYMAGWFSSFPAAHLTPYEGIHSVPPCSVVRLESGRQTIRRFWEFDPAKRVRYGTDKEYEEHFRVVFFESVRRRLRSDAPVLSELSGGVDSSSIVCVADSLLQDGRAGTKRLDTVSYYDDSEPNWNERPYFSKVEEKRGRTGFHIDVASQEPIPLETNPFDDDFFAATPAFLGRQSKGAKQLGDFIALQNYRVVLSGIGGDEVTGGVPTPVPELCDLLVERKLAAFVRALQAWALALRRPWFHLLLETGKEFLPLSADEIHPRMLHWMATGFAERNRAALSVPRQRQSLFTRDVLPSFRQNLSAVELLSRQLTCFPIPRDPVYEKRYPFLDRDLLEFLFAIPRDQLLRAGRRRFLIRRALDGIVPDELLNRKRKAYVVRAPTLSIAATGASLARQDREMLCATLGYIDPTRFAESLQSVRQENDVPIFGLLRVFETERWLRNIARAGLQVSPD